MANNGGLIERLNEGDLSAARELFVSYAPYLRAVARSLLSQRLRAQFDSSDVVQSVWVQVVSKLKNRTLNVATEPELRALLVTITQRRAISRARKATSSTNAEQALNNETQGHFDLLPRPSEVAQADDLWNKIIRLCPPEHLEVIRLRRQGLTSEEIAARTGLHDGSVRRILRQVARKLASSGYHFDKPESD